MNVIWKDILWRQFGASIDMLGKALRACPEDLWSVRMWKDPDMPPEFSEFWYVVYHTLFWLDLYLSGAVDCFTPPAPFTLDELDPAGLLPERRYSREELLSYLAHCRSKCQTTLEELSDEKARQLVHFLMGSGSLWGTAAGQYAPRPGTCRAVELDPWSGSRHSSRMAGWPEPKMIMAARRSAYSGFSS